MNNGWLDFCAKVIIRNINYISLLFQEYFASSLIKNVNYPSRKDAK